MEIGLEWMRDEGERSHSETREADRIYVGSGARAATKLEIREGGWKFDLWLMQSMKKRKVGILPLFSSQMHIHPIQSRAFIQAVCPTTRRENISSLFVASQERKTGESVSFF